MTDLQAERDRLAGLCGWVLRNGLWMRYKRSIGLSCCKSDHPFPPGDLTALAAAWPDGWVLYLIKDSSGQWYADGTPQGRSRPCMDLGTSPTEYAARLLLTIAALEAGKGDGR